MGLDMTLEKKICINDWSNDKNLSIRVEVGNQIAILHPPSIELTVDEIYWRKANWIHEWFVDNIQHGIDDCGTYRIEKEELEELLTTITRILKAKEESLEKGENLALELLPPVEGFFFGSNQIDEYYWLDLAQTATDLENLLKLKLNLDTKDIPRVYTYYHYEYSSSW